MSHELAQTWAINARIDTYLLAAISDEALAATSPAKGRSVGEQFAHLHNVRLMWLESAAPDLKEGLEKLGKEGLNGAMLREHLEASAKAIEQLIKRGLTEGRIKGFKPHPSAFVGYLIAHESHHRGQIVLILKQAGHPVDKKVLFGMWEWGVR
jgi:uncharacterized damage-inducible protein DinB